VCQVRDDGCSGDVRVVHVIACAPVVLIVVDDKPCGQPAAQDGPPDDCAGVPGEAVTRKRPRDVPGNLTVIPVRTGILARGVPA
jgi:hypothetical protein